MPNIPSVKCREVGCTAANAGGRGCNPEICPEVAEEEELCPFCKKKGDGIHEKWCVKGPRGSKL